jgi:hypothetical protein
MAGLIESTVQETTVASDWLPALSIARMLKACGPCDKSPTVTDEMQVANEAPLRLHWVLATPEPPMSEAENVIVSLIDDLTPLGPLDTVTVGLVASTVQVNDAGVASTTESNFALTWKVWLPSANPA